MIITVIHRICPLQGSSSRTRTYGNCHRKIWPTRNDKEQCSSYVDDDCGGYSSEEWKPAKCTKGLKMGEARMLELSRKSSYAIPYIILYRRRSPYFWPLDCEKRKTFYYTKNKYYHYSEYYNRIFLFFRDRRFLSPYPTRPLISSLVYYRHRLYKFSLPLATTDYTLARYRRVLAFISKGEVYRV